ncbi:MAG: hypothetical protein AAGF74_10555 [Pseudomonadota bacterium]
MANILINNGAQPAPFAKGALNASFTKRARNALVSQGRGMRASLLHLTTRFFDLERLPTFGSFKVMTGPDIEAGFARFDAQLKAILRGADSAAA